MRSCRMGSRVARVLTQQLVLAPDGLGANHFLLRRCKVTVPKKGHALCEWRWGIEHFLHPPDLYVDALAQLCAPGFLAFFVRAAVQMGRTGLKHRGGASRLVRLGRRQQSVHRTLPGHTHDRADAAWRGRKTGSHQQVKRLIGRQGLCKGRASTQRQQAQTKRSPQPNDPCNEPRQCFFSTISHNPTNCKSCYKLLTLP